jgi:hypothetical protein
MTIDLVQHLEAQLGPIVDGFGDQAALHVVRFFETPRAGVTTYCTLGLSQHLLRLPSGKQVRQELLLSVHDSYDPAAVASALLMIAERLIHDHRALARGEVMGLAAPLIAGVRARAVYTSLPVVFDDALMTFHSTNPPTVLVWLIPLPAEEAQHVRDHGWEAFEDALESAEAELWDLNRSPLEAVAAHRLRGEVQLAR